MFKFNKVALSVGAALALGYGGMVSAVPTAPAVVADAFLRVDNFSILNGWGDGTAAKEGTPFTFCLSVSACPGGEQLALSQINATSLIVATMTGQPNFVSSPAPGNTIDFPINHSGSTGPGYTPYAFIPPQPTATYSGVAAKAEGNSLAVAGSDNKTHAQTSIDSFGNLSGTGSANLGLTTTFFMNVAGDTDFEINFDADGYLRAALGQLTQAAQASLNWNITVQGVNGTLGSASWTPGSAISCSGTVTVCNEIVSGANLSTTISAASLPFGNDQTFSFASSPFEANVRIGEGAYQVTINHVVSTSGSINQVVPEPGTMALLGLGLLGLGLTARRKVA